MAFLNHSGMDVRHVDRHTRMLIMPVVIATQIENRCGFSLKFAIMSG